MTRLIALLLVALAGITTGYNTPKSTQPSIRSTSSQPTINRSTFLATTATACLTFLSTPQSASAKEVDPALVGTKKDPAFESCLGKCLYECTKPKGFEQKGRAECLPECKTQCATTKAQLMRGEPIKK
eukprot:CAMPEP_0201868640 /NCGR_PEP_ID=MMETSP0902-20130614/2440_1 /ASSEMBLY_ACC=CAM_ASM_000551 /TAXON_ID=420261 /ORGANISM="Thalassiosira antarctica, Strain CCMP982" /LENGTH=127 /DNA_ID=CAMNT_0048394001 /DNA_START=39 /DNA_END=425 /DNA_ORIENTATION=-